MKMERCEALGIAYLIAHPGAHVGAGEETGIKTIAKSIDDMHKACAGFTTKTRNWKSPRDKAQILAIGFNK